MKKLSDDEIQVAFEVGLMIVFLILMATLAAFVATST